MVRDSIALRSLIVGGRDEFRLKFKNQVDDASPETARINWKAKIPWNSKDEEVRRILDELIIRMIIP